MKEHTDHQMDPHASDGPSTGTPPSAVRRRRVRIAWDEKSTYQQDVDIEVPAGYTGDVWDLITPDDAPFGEGDLPGVPAGYRSGWLERIDPTAVFSVENRCIYEVTATEPADPEPPPSPTSR